MISEQYSPVLPVAKPQFHRIVGPYFIFDVMKVGQVFDVQINKMAYKGLGIARVKEEERESILFVQQAIPGEECKVVVTKKKKGVGHARKLETLKASPDEQAAPCPYFGVCGGCKWQNLAIEKQMEYKQQFIQESLTHIGKITNVPELPPIIPSPESFGYRNKIELSFGVVPYTDQANYHSKRKAAVEVTEAAEGEASTKAVEEEGRYLGYHGSGSFYKIVDVDHCMLMHDGLRGVVETIKHFIQKKGLPAYNVRTHEGLLRHLVVRYGVHTGEVMVHLITNTTEDYTREFWEPLVDELRLLEKEDFKMESILWSVNSSKADVAKADETYVLHGRDYIIDKIGNFMFKISAFSFFQTNTKGAEKLYDVVKDFAQIGDNEVVLDLYSGTGTIGMYLAKEAKKIFSLEENTHAVEDAKTNAKLNNIHNIEFISGKVEKDAFSLLFERPDTVIIDPPRGGMHPKALQLLPKFRARKIVYVSCNPTTLARDLEFLAKKYKITKVQGVDMFPQTYHVETVVLLETKE